MHHEYVRLTLATVGLLLFIFIHFYSWLVDSLSCICQLLIIMMMMMVVVVVGGVAVMSCV